MSINFFAAECTHRISNESFGLCDDQNNTRAHIDIHDETKWNAIVENKSNQTITFVAIDHCIPIYKENGDEDTCCDGMLLHINGIIFIELKNKRFDWIDEGVEQLKHTICLFKDNHDLSCYKNKRAYLANKKHPQYNHSHKEMMRHFKTKLGVFLLIMNEIII